MENEKQTQQAIQAQNEVREAQQILMRTRLEKDVAAYQEAESVVKYFRQVREGEKVVAKAYPNIPENERDLYL